MFNFVCSLSKKYSLLLLFLPLVLLGGCSTSETSPTTIAPTSVAQSVFPSYVGKWQVHGSLISINADHTGLEQWNAGPCSDKGQMCNGNDHITFTENADGSIKGTIQSASYSQWNGNPAPTGYQPNTADPQAGDTFQLQHSGAHLLYTTWFGAKLGYLNNSNRYWCDAYALTAGWKQCGA